MTFRKPNEKYLRPSNRSAFDDYALNSRVTESASEDAQDLARFVTQEMGSPFPDIAEMRKYVEEPDTSASLKERIERLKKQHVDTVTKLVIYYGRRIEDDKLARYLETDDLKYLNDLPEYSEWKEHYARLENFYERNDRIQKEEFYDVLGQVQYEHLKALLPLYKRRTEMQRLEEETRIRLTAQFPQSTSEYRNMRIKPAQLRVAQFLMADDKKREEMRDESRWAWRQTEPLIRVYGSNRVFQNEIESLVKEYAGSSWPR